MPPPAASGDRSLRDVGVVHPGRERWLPSAAVEAHQGALGAMLARVASRRTVLDAKGKLHEAVRRFGLVPEARRDECWYLRMAGHRIHNDESVRAVSVLERGRTLYPNSARLGALLAAGYGMVGRPAEGHRIAKDGVARGGKRLDAEFFEWARILVYLTEGRYVQASVASERLLQLAGRGRRGFAKSSLYEGWEYQAALSNVCSADRADLVTGQIKLANGEVVELRTATRLRLLIQAAAAAGKRDIARNYLDQLLEYKVPVVEDVAIELCLKLDHRLYAAARRLGNPEHRRTRRLEILGAALRSRVRDKRGPLRRATAAWKADTPQIQRLGARMLLDVDPEAAIPILRSLLLLYPEHAGLHHDLGIALQRTGGAGSALELLHASRMCPGMFPEPEPSSPAAGAQRELQR